MKNGLFLVKELVLMSNSQYPELCRGYTSLIDNDQGAPTATWPAGSNQTWSIEGEPNPGNGTCQVAFLDSPNSLTLVQGYHGTNGSKMYMM